MVQHIKEYRLSKHSSERYIGRYQNRDFTDKIVQMETLQLLYERNPIIFFLCDDELTYKKIFYSDEGIWVTNKRNIITFIHMSMLSPYEKRAIEYAKAGKMEHARYWYNFYYYQRKCA